MSATDPNRVDPSTERVVFKIQWPGRENNRGGLAFGPDGMLYIGLGDGGFVHGPSGADDPFNVDPELLFGDLVAQDLTSLYGKILRIDVDRGDPYGIPPDNPFVGRDGFPPEIYAWGFRNPFRISFDREGDRAMYVSAPADTLFEATYKVTGPGNHGWAVKEGTHCIVRTSAFAPPETLTCSSDAQCPSGPQVSMCGRKGVCTCPRVGPLGERIRSPVIEYLNFAVEDPRSRFPGQGFGRASLGGHVYRGKEIEWLRGRFVQGDFALNLLDGQIWAAEEDATWQALEAATGVCLRPRRCGEVGVHEEHRSGCRRRALCSDRELHADRAPGPDLEDHRRIGVVRRHQGASNSQRGVTKDEDERFREPGHPMRYQTQPMIGVGTPRAEWSG